MKKQILFAGIALLALPACSNDGRAPWSEHSNSNNQGSSDYANRDGEHDGMWHHGWDKDKMDDKVNMMVDRFFQEADTNHDGNISRKEFDRFLHKKFAEADTDHNGMLSRDEVVSMKRKEMKSMHEEMHGDKHYDNYSPQAGSRSNSNNSNNYSNGGSANDNGSDYGTRSEDRAGGDTRSGTVNASDNNGNGNDRY